jgi:hypothetical protein
MIDVMDIMKQIEHMETNTPEQMQERYKEACRLIKEREDETIRAIEENHKASMENHKAFMEKHETFMLNYEERARISTEKHNIYMMELRLQMMKEARPKRQIYFGKVKTE